MSYLHLSQTKGFVSPSPSPATRRGATLEPALVRPNRPWEPSDCVHCDLSAESDVLLIAFTGNADERLGTAPFEFVKPTEDIPVKKIFLRDPENLWFQKGVPGVGNSVDAVCSYLSKLRDDNNIRRVVVIGNSAGGFAAILFGILMGADEIHAFVPQTLLMESTNSVSPEMQAPYASYLDLRDLAMTKRQKNTSVFVHYDVKEARDSRHARYVADVSGFHLVPHSVGGHAVVTVLKQTGALKRLLQEALLGYSTVSKTEVFRNEQNSMAFRDKLRTVANRTRRVTEAIPQSGDPVLRKEGTVPVSKDQRLVCLDGLRGLLALFVVFGHCGGFLSAQGYDGLTFLAFGFRVPAFFALSGFVLYLSSAHREHIEMKTPFRQFVGRRLLRLYPPYIAALLLFLSVTYAAVLTGLAKPSAIPPHSGESLLAHLFYLQSWQPNLDIKEGVIRPTWMLGYELQLTLLLPVFLAIARSVGWGGLLFLGLCLTTPEAQRWNQDANQQLLFHPSFTLSFLLGLAAARLVKAPSFSGAGSRLCQIVLKFRASLALGTAVIAAGAHLYCTYGLKNSSLSQCGAGLCVAAFCVFLALQPTSWAGRVLSCRPFRFLGTISYSLFLVHFPLITFTQFALGHWNIPSADYYLALTALLPVIIGVAVMFHRYCELPLATFVERLVRWEWPARWAAQAHKATVLMPKAI